MSDTKRELKTCELCGKLFARPTPASAREGEKLCPACLITGPSQEMIDADNGLTRRSYHLTGVRIKT